MLEPWLSKNWIFISGYNYYVIIFRIAAAVSMGGKLGNTELFSEKTC